MPFTFNGVGTRYAGRSNLSVVQANCPSCGRFVRLSSYDTREFFCVVFIPLIPLRKFRILHDCPICRRHRRIPLGQFQQELSEQIEPLRQEVRRSPGDPAVHVRLVAGLIDFQMFTEAAQAAQEGVALHPRSLKLNLLAGELAELRGDLPGATGFYRQAAAAEPLDFGARTALGRTLLAAGETAEAARELEQARRLDPSDAQVPYLLGQALARDQRWPEALSAFEAAAGRDPALAADPELLRRMAECKQALGFPLTDQERKSRRWRWWPFRRSRKAVAPPRPMGALEPRRMGILLGLILAGCAVFFVGGALWKQRQTDVYFDNALRKPLRVTVDGETFALPSGPTVERSLGTGKHMVRVSGPGGEVERATIEIPPMGFFEAIAEHRLFVYNVAAARVYQREEIGYAEAQANQTYKRTLIGMQRFFEQDGVDYVFQKAPDTITVDGGTTVVKVALNGTSLDLNQLGVAWYEEGKKREAERALRKALETDGCASSAHPNLIHLLVKAERGDEALAEARKWIAGCPDQGVTPHRAYQNALLDLGRRDQAVAEYKARLDAHPEVGANHYLYGRLFDDPARTLKLYSEAVSLDPQLSWARGALAHDLMKLERDAEAMDHLEVSLKIPGHDQSYVVEYVMAAIGAGATARAKEVMRGVTKGTGEGEDELWRAHWLLALAGGNYDDAEKRLRQRIDAAGEEDQESWGYRLQLARLRGDPEAATALLEGKRWPDAEYTLCSARMERALEADDYAKAARIVDEAKPENRMLQLYAAAAQLLAGDRKGAEARLLALEEKLKPETHDTDDVALLSLARYLRGEAKEEGTLLASRFAGYEYLPHAYFLLGARAAADGDAARARAFFEKSRAQALDLKFPYLAAKARARG